MTRLSSSALPLYEPKGFSPNLQLAKMLIVTMAILCNNNDNRTCLCCTLPNNKYWMGSPLFCHPLPPVLRCRNIIWCPEGSCREGSCSRLHSCLTSEDESYVSNTLYKWSGERCDKICGHYLSTEKNSAEQWRVPVDSQTGNGGLGGNEVCSKPVSTPIYA